MSNDYWNFTSPLGLGLARSDQINAFFEGIEDAFDMLPAPEDLALGTVGFGITTGSGNAYILTLDPPISEYVEGMKIQFQANHTNSGASTIDVDGQGVTQIRDQSGSVLFAGALVEGSLYEARYLGGVFRAAVGLVTQGRLISTGTGLTGGGDLSADRTLALTSHSADLLTSGTVPSARISGSYTGITGTGALGAGSITSGFGSIDVGSDAITGGTITGTTFTVAASLTVGTNIFCESSVVFDGVLAYSGGGAYMTFRPAAGPTGGTTTNQMVLAAASGNLIIAGSLFESSDERLKENVEPIAGALASVLRLQGVTYTRSDGERAEVGLLAQDLESVIPEMVSTDEAGMKAIAYSKVCAVLIEAVKEQQATITALQAAVAALQAGGR